MHHRRDESFDRLSAQGSSARIAHRHAQQYLGNTGLEAGADGSLGVECVENGFDEDAIDALLDEHLYLFKVSRLELVEGDGTCRGVIGILAHGEHLAGGADIAQHKDLPVGHFGGCLSRQSYGGTIHGDYLSFEVIVVLRDALRGEGIGRNDIRTGCNVAPMYIEDCLGIGERKVVVVALHQQRAHGTIQKKDSLAKSLS